MNWIKNKLTEAQYMVEEMEASAELTALSVKLSEIEDDINELDRNINMFIPICGGK